jgi:uncharacterized membrane protein
MSDHPYRSSPDHQTTLPQLQSLVDQIESNPSIDALSERIQPLARRAGEPPAGDVLRGRWLGHALHPLLTDLPLGCFLAAGLLDVVGGRKGQRSAQRLIGLGLLAVPATVASGLAEWDQLRQPETRRIGTAHAMGNGVAAACYFLSWRARRRGRHLTGMTLGMVGGSIAVVTGYLGGHLSFARGAGVEDRGVGPPVEAQRGRDAERAEEEDVSVRVVEPVVPGT